MVSLGIYWPWCSYMIVFVFVQGFINYRNLHDRDAKIDNINNTLQNMQGQMTAFRELGARILPSGSTCWTICP